MQSSPPKTPWAKLLTRIPFVLTFLLVAWPVFLGLVRSNGWIPDALRPHVGFVLEKWRYAPLEAFAASNAGLVVQHSWGQIVYITALLIVFGIQYELRAGALRTFAVFYGASAAGVITLLLILAGAYLEGSHGWTAAEARISWSGASVGCFGLIGALAASSRHPWRNLGIWAAYAVGVEWTLVPGLPVILHAAGFAFGFLFALAARGATPMGPPLPTPVPTPDPDD